MTEEIRESISSLTKARVEVSHGQEVEGSEVNVLIQTDAGLFAAFHI